MPAEQPSRERYREDLVAETLLRSFGHGLTNEAGIKHIQAGVDQH